MGNSAIIEVAIGLIFVYSLLSILVTQINTIIGNILNLRAERLREGLAQLLTDPIIQARIMTHPLIGIVENRLPPTERITAEQAGELSSAKTTPVNWIEPDTFVDVLTDVLTGERGAKLYAALNKAVEAMPASIEKSQIRELIRKLQISGTGLPELREAIRNIADPTLRQSLLDALTLVEDALDALQVESSDLIPLLLGIRQIQDPHLQQALEAVLTTANSLKDAQEKIGAWFDNSMTQASDLFKREMQRISIVIGLLLALILNADTVQLGRTLWEDPALRQAVAATAEASAPQLAAQAAGSTQPPEEVDASVQAARSTLDSLLNLRLPVGWNFSPVDDAALALSTESALLPDPRWDPRNLWNFIPGNSPHWVSLVIQKVIGLLITTIAIAQGAPFWFDLLNKLTARKS